MQRLPADRAIHRAAVDVPVAERGGDRARDGPLPCARRTVDSDDQRIMACRRSCQTYRPKSNMRSVRFLTVDCVSASMLAAIAFLARPYLRGLRSWCAPPECRAPRDVSPTSDASAAAEREIEIPPPAARCARASTSRRRVAARAALLVPPVGAAGIDEPRLVGAGAAARRQRPHDRHPGYSRAVALRDRARGDRRDRAGGALAGFGDGARARRQGRPDRHRLQRRARGRRGRPAVAVGPVAYVLSVGGHRRSAARAAYLCTGTEPRPGNQIQLGANTTEQDPAAFVRPPADYGLAMLLVGIAPRVVPAGAGAAAARSAVARFLEHHAARAHRRDRTRRRRAGGKRRSEAAARAVGDAVALSRRARRRPPRRQAAASRRLPTAAMPRCRHRVRRSQPRRCSSCTAATTTSSPRSKPSIWPRNCGDVRRSGC